MVTEERKLYAAYGSNLNLEQMAYRCPTAIVAGTAILPDKRLLFRGRNGGAVATVERRKGYIVPLLIWEIQPKDEEALDIYEGYPQLYRKKTVRVNLDGKSVTAMIYIMNQGCSENPPNIGYLNIIRKGYVSAGFDLKILQKALKESTERGGNAMKPAIKEQILAIRKTGRTNMLDTNAVQRIAFEMEFYELVNFIEDNRKAYANFIFTGETEP